MLVGSGKGLIHFSGLGFSTAYKHIRKKNHGERLYPTKDIYSGGSCSNTDSLPAMLLRPIEGEWKTISLNKELNTISQTPKITGRFLL